MLCFPYSPNAWCHAFLRYLVSLKNGVTKQNVQETAPVLTSFRKLVTSLLSLGRGELHENQNDPLALNHYFHHLVATTALYDSVLHIYDMVCIVREPFMQSFLYGYE
jgi:hypothetical protein